MTYTTTHANLYIKIRRDPTLENEYYQYNIETL